MQTQETTIHQCRQWHAIEGIHGYIVEVLVVFKFTFILKIEE
jgi:hypothetical protein